MPAWLPSWRQLTRSTPMLGKRTYTSTGGARVFFNKDRNEFQVDSRYHRCDIYGLSDSAWNAAGKVVLHEGSQDIVLKALRDHDVPLPDGPYALLCRKDSFRDGSHRTRCVVGRITPSNTFEKVTVIDIITDYQKLICDSIISDPVTLAS